MRNIIIGSVLALIGFGSIAQASDYYRTSGQGAARVHVSDDVRGERHECRDRSRVHHDEWGERHDESRETHRERNDRHTIVNPPSILPASTERPDQ